MSGRNDLVSVVFPIPGGGPYTYRVPVTVNKELVRGARVVAPLGSRVLTGFVVGGESAAPEGVKIRPLIEVLDREPLVPPGLIELALWMAHYYFCEPGEALRAVVPSVFLRKGDRLVRLSGKAQTLPEGLTKIQASLWEYLKNHGETLLSRLKKDLGARRLSPALRALADRGVLEQEDYLPSPPARRTFKMVEAAREIPGAEELDRLLSRTPRQRECLEFLRSQAFPVELSHLTRKLGFSPSVVEGLESRGLVCTRREEIFREPPANVGFAPCEEHTPSPDQRKAIERIKASLRVGEHRVFLLHGVTGSGKTLVYLEVLRPVVESGRQGIVLVPEIALTPQTTGRFRAVFGDRVAVIHSGLSESERHDIWLRIRQGRYSVAVGARSAVFAPFADPGIVVIDEEHENTYKQTDSAPRYHAREVAIKRMHEARGLVVLGSATPSLESFHNADLGKFVRIGLPDRVAGRMMPRVRIHDLRKGWIKGKGNLVTERLVEEAGQAIASGGQVLLLLNRRGFSRFVICENCGNVCFCPSCRISLTVHQGGFRMLCHYCGHNEPVPEKCPVCGEEALFQVGMGTEQVESQLRKAFPGRVVDRMDMDTTSGKWSHHLILDRLRTGATDILVGTQMIAKGLDFPNVVLVGVVNADTAMNLPDFRATERTFQLLAQVAGRTGRGEKGGEVFIQTFNPGHPAVTAAIDHDYQRFAARELALRREAGYPPYVRLVNVVFSGTDEAAVKSFANRGAVFLAGLIQARSLAESLEMVGPAPCALERVRKLYRWHLILKSESPSVLEQVGSYLVRRVKPPREGGCRLTLDRDPASLM